MVALALLGCETEQVVPPSPEDSAPQVEEACTLDPEAFGEVQSSPVIEQPSVLRVTWSAPEPSDVLVHFQDALGVDRRLVAATDHALVLGLAEGTPVSVYLSGWVDGEWVCSPPMETTYGYFSSGLPELALAPLSGPTTPAFIAVPFITEVQNYAAVVETASGNPVWVWRVPEEFRAAPLYRVALRADGGGILANTNGAWDTPGHVFRVDWDGSYTDVPIPYASRDFTELPDGRIAVLASEVGVTDDGVFVIGDLLLEIGLDDDVVEVWNLFDQFPHELGTLSPSTEKPVGFVDYAHANSVTWDPAAGDYLIGLSNLASIARIDGATGELKWLLSGNPNEGDFASDETLVDEPHSVQILEDDNLLIFNRHFSCAEALEVHLDMDTMVAVPVWSHAASPCLTVPFLGQAMRLPDGETLISWSSAGTLDIVTPEGETVWRLDLDLGAGFGFVEYADHLGVEG